MDKKEDLKIKNNIKNTFDDVAKSYDRNKQFIISAQKMVKLIELDSDDLYILDLSTGTGNIAIELAKKFPKANIFGVDISNEMLNIARDKTKKQSINNITYQMQDVENLKFDGIKFDLITCGYGLFFYPNMDKVFRNICNKLKNNGKFVFSTFTDIAFEPYSKIFLDMLDTNYGIKPPNKIEKKQLKTENEIKELSSQIEYKNLEIKNIDIKFPMSINEWWDLLNSTGYQGLLNQLESNYSKFEKEYIEHLKSISNNNNIKYNANSFISILRL